MRSITKVLTAPCAPRLPAAQASLRFSLGGNPTGYPEKPVGTDEPDLDGELSDFKDHLCHSSILKSDMATASSPGKPVQLILLVFPWRRYCWVPLLAGLAGFALLRSRRPQAGEIYHNYLGSGLPLDICGFFFFTLFFAIPFWVSDPTRQMWTEDLGVTILCWLAALGALSLVVWAAWNASFAIRVEPGRLVIARLFRLLPP